MSPKNVNQAEKECFLSFVKNLVLPNLDLVLAVTVYIYMAIYALVEVYTVSGQLIELYPNHCDNIVFDEFAAFTQYGRLWLGLCVGRIIVKQTLEYCIQANSTVWYVTNILLDLIVHCLFFGWKLPMKIVILCLPLCLIGATNILPGLLSKTTVFLCALSVLVTEMHSHSISNTNSNRTVFLYNWLPSLLVGYKQLQVISAVTHMIDEQYAKKHVTVQPTVIDKYLRLLHYIMYWPLQYLLIVPYGDFLRRSNERSSPFEALMAHKRLMLTVLVCSVVASQMPKYMLPQCVLLDEYFVQHFVGDSKSVFLSMLLGCVMLFQLNYSVFFGSLNLLLAADGLEPSESPICLIRACRFSSIWRNFDRGLYAFLKTHIHKPILALACRFGSSPISVHVWRLVAMTSVFSVIGVWHDITAPAIRLWTALNCMGTVTEHFITPSLRPGRSTTNQRLWIALSNLPIFCTILFSNAYFFGHSSGSTGNKFWKLVFGDLFSLSQGWSNIQLFGTFYLLNLACLQCGDLFDNHNTRHRIKEK